MSSAFKKILHDHYVEGVFHSHVSMVQPRGRFQFNRPTLEKFFDEYCDIIYKNKTQILGIAEKPDPNQYMPVLVDVDLKVKDEGDIEIENEHLYNENQIIQLIGIYQSVIREIVENCNEENLICCLLEKPIYYIDVGDNMYIKNGFHLHFPNLFLSSSDQEAHLLPRIQKLVKEEEVFSSLNIKDSSTVIDTSYCKTPWLLYGSRKSEDMDPYVLTNIYDASCKIISMEEAFFNYKIYNDNEDQIKLIEPIEKYLPRILSIKPYNREVYEIKPGIMCPLKEKMTEIKREKKEINVSVSDALKQSEKLLSMLSDHRAEDYNEWIKVGWVLYNVGDGSMEALEQWLNFSARNEEKYDEAYCISQWERMVKKDLTLGTLYHWAKIDSPKQLQEYNDSKQDEHIKDALNGSHNDIARLLYDEFRNEFVCSSITNKTWYQYKENHRWEEMEEGIYLRQKISEEISNKFIKIQIETSTKCYTTEDKAERAMLEARMKQIHKIIVNLKSAPYKNNIMKEAMEVFYDRRFSQKLDQDPYLICFKNGVYDLKTNEFRDGIPEDFISKSIPIEYKTYNEADEEVQNVIEFLQKVFPDNSIRKYFLDTYSDIFVGGNNQKKVYLWTGEGDNGKSITQSFFEKMLGELAIKFNTQYFTGKKTSTGTANPELSRAAPPVRHATMEEPDADEQLNIGELKKLSGGDSYWARDLFQTGKNTREVFPMFMLTFICNKLPKLKYSDKATWNRLRVIPFESTFVEPGADCPETFEEQLREKRFPMDKNFSSKIPGIVSAFAWYLLEWRQKVTVRFEPEKVKEATSIYRRQNDIYRQFIEECIVEDNNSILSLTELYAQFKEWYKEGWATTTVPIKNEVKEYFEKLWNECDHGKWMGYRIRTLQEDLDEGNAVMLNESDLVNYENNHFPPM
tara:strand:+ start:73 stop:2808 length:2736 start_codon:yes stop_codon:yes gene_type:complete